MCVHARARACASMYACVEAREHFLCIVPSRDPDSDLENPTASEPGMSTLDSGPGGGAGRDDIAASADFALQARTLRFTQRNLWRGPGAGRIARSAFTEHAVERALFKAFL